MKKFPLVYCIETETKQHMNILDKIFGLHISKVWN